MSGEATNRSGCRGFAACDFFAFVWRGGGLWAGGLCVCGLSGGGEAAVVAGVAAKSDRVWEFALFGVSAFAGNPVLISLEQLAHDGWIAWDRIAGLPGHDGAADFDGAARLKMPLIEEAAGNFLDHAPDEKLARFRSSARTIFRGCRICDVQRAAADAWVCELE